MRHYRIVILVVLIVAAALLAGYVIGRGPGIDAPVAATSKQKNLAPKNPARTRTNQASASVASAKPVATSAPTAPTLKDVYADLKRRADANDAAAASELYRDLRRCQMEQELSRGLPQWVGGELDRDTSGETPEQLKLHEQFLESMQREIAFVQRNAAFCADTDAETLVQLAPATLKAAQLGDLTAIRCYIGNEIQMVPGLLDHPEWLGDFKRNALPLAQYGFEHGDWGTAALLGHAYGGSFSSSFFSQVVKPDPLQAYQYLKLQTLGARGEFAQKLQNQVASAADGLTSDQISQADAWAQDMYARYFDGTSSNELSNGVNTCGRFDED